MLLRILKIKTPGLYLRAHPRIEFTAERLDTLRRAAWVETWCKLCAIGCLAYGLYWMSHHGPLGGLLGISFAGLFYGMRGETPAFVFDAIKATLGKTDSG